MRKSPIFEEIDRIAEMRKYYNKCLAKDINVSRYLEDNSNNFFFKITHSQLDLVKILCFI